MIPDKVRLIDFVDLLFSPLNFENGSTNLGFDTDHIGWPHLLITMR